MAMVSDERVLEGIEYEVQFLNCDCELSKKDRRNLLRRHTSVKQKGEVLKRQRRWYTCRISKEQQCTGNLLVECIEKFNRDIMEGPYYICVVCNRLLYRKTVIEFKNEK